MQVNMRAPAHLTRLFLPEMLRRGSGRILNVASTAAYVPGPFMAMYYASKAFLLSFSHAMANEVKGNGRNGDGPVPGSDPHGICQQGRGRGESRSSRVR